MIQLIRAMMRTRRAQALLMVVLATVTVSAAVAVPAFLAVADDSVIQTEVAHASAAELDVFATQSYRLTSPDMPADSAFGRDMPRTLAGPDFAQTFSAVTDAAVIGKADLFPQLEFRQGACEHVVIGSGRCPLGTAEVMIDSRLAHDEDLAVGDTTSLIYAVKDPHAGWLIVHSDRPLTVAVVGIYRPRDAAEPYWGEVSLFGDRFDRGVDAPMLTTAGTISTFDHATEAQTVDAVLQPAALTPSRLSEVQALASRGVAAAQKAGAVSGSGIGSLAAKISQDRSTARQLVPLLAVPLIAVGWFVIFLAGGYAASGRREEFGVIALRGASWWPRWALGTGESLLALLVAVPCGYVVGYAAVWAVDRLAVPHHPALAGWGYGSLPYVLVTVAGCAAAILGSAWRTLRTPATDLLRNVAPRTGRWRSASIELALIAVAVTSVITMRGEHTRLVGIELIAPGLAIAAIAVVAARLVVPVTSWFGAWNLRRGRGLGMAISALQMARRPGAARLFVLLVTVIGLTTFAVAATDVAHRSRSDRAAMEVGAPTVLSVQPTSRQALVHAVRQVDPAGTFAMAVVRIPQPAAHGPAIIGVDASRLARVAVWPSASTMSAADAARVLAPPAGSPVTFAAQTVSLTLTADRQATRFDTPAVSLLVEPLSGGAAQSLPMGLMQAGTWAYQADTTACIGGCRLSGITIYGSSYGAGVAAITFRSLTVVLPKPAMITTFSDATGWRDTQSVLTGSPAAGDPASGGGLIMRPTNRNGVNMLLEPTDNAFPVPAIATAGFTVPLMGQLGDVPIPMRSAAVVTALPRVAGNGILVDLQDLDRAVPAVGDEAESPEVWLSASAPADVVSRLEKAGLIVFASSSIAAERTYLGRRGPAVAGLFAWIVVAGVLLLMVGAVVLTASVDRVRRSSELRALRVQGLAAGRVRGAALFGHVALAVAAVLVGLVAGLAGWWLTGARVPVFADGLALVGAPTWPAWTGVIVPLGVVAAALFVVSSAAAWDLRRGVPN